MIIFNELTCKMSVEKYTSYIDAYREFRINMEENDFHDDYPETAEMTLAICSGLRYHYIRDYRSLTADQSIQLIETFAKRCAKLEDYRHTLNECLYSPESMIMHEHWFDNMDPVFNEWLLLCHAYGLITLKYERQRNIYMTFAYRNTWLKRNTIRLKAIDKDIKRRSELQQKLSDMGKLVNKLDEFNHIYKFTNIPSIDIKTGERSYKYVIDSYYDGHVDERLGTDTIYEWILNDDVNRFQQWYNDGELREYDNVQRGKYKNLKYREDIADHILASNAVKIIRFIIMNDIHEFLDDIDGGWASMDPWRKPVNDLECFRLLQERFKEEHNDVIAEFVNSESVDYLIVSRVYRHIRPEIAEAIYQEISEISVRLCGTVDIYLCLYVAVEMAKFGHIGPIESLDWEAVTKTLSDINSYTVKNKYVTAKVAQLIRPRYDLISLHRDCLAFGMNPSTAVYIHNLFSENGLDRIDSIGTGLRKQFLDVFGEDVEKYIIPRI